MPAKVVLTGLELTSLRQVWALGFSPALPSRMWGSRVCSTPCGLTLCILKVQNNKSLRFTGSAHLYSQHLEGGAKEITSLK